MTRLQSVRSPVCNAAVSTGGRHGGRKRTHVHYDVAALDGAHVAISRRSDSSEGEGGDGGKGRKRGDQSEDGERKSRTRLKELRIMMLMS